MRLRRCERYDAARLTGANEFQHWFKEHLELQSGEPLRLRRLEREFESVYRGQGRAGFGGATAEHRSQ
jgi:hypothetical protein